MGPQRVGHDLSDFTFTIETIISDSYTLEDEYMSQAPCFMYIITVDPPNAFLVSREIKKMYLMTHSYLV